MHLFLSCFSLAMAAIYSSNRKTCLCAANMEKRRRLNQELHESIKLRDDELFHFVEKAFACRQNYMPSFTRLSDEFMRLVRKEYVDEGMLRYLTDAKAINCLQGVNTFFPLMTTGL